MTAPLMTAHERGITTLTLDSRAQPQRPLHAPGGRTAPTPCTDAADDDRHPRRRPHATPANTFCAGADLRGPAAARTPSWRCCGCIVALPKPVVARVTGHARAGGLGLLGACDIAVAGPAATFAFTEARIGVAPAVISLPLLPRLDPRAAARYYLTGETLRRGGGGPDRPGDPRGADDVDAALAPVLDGLRRAARRRALRRVEAAGHALRCWTPSTGTPRP